MNSHVPDPQVTPEEAHAVLAGLTPSARRFLAYVVSRQHLEMSVSVAERRVDLAALNLRVADPDDDRAALADALLHDVTGQYGNLYTPPGSIEVAPSTRLMALLWAIVTGEPQTFLG
jgi:hypothetical protein